MTASNQRGGRVLVTGGAGFLGTHLCARLLDRGDEVVCVDDLSSGRTEAVERLSADARFQFVQGDVCDGLDFEVDRIFNLACPASPVRYQCDPIQTTRTSVLGAISALELAERTGARILQASTSEVYGDPDISPQDEGYAGRVNPIGSRSCYDEGKRCAESLFFDYHRKRGVRIKIARIFNTYGPGMRADDGRVVSNFITQALTDRPITIFGTGTQKRAFCYVDDLIDGLILLMESPDEVTGPVNLGRPVETSMLDLARIVLEETGSASEVVHEPLPHDDPQQRCPDISRARRLLGWEPKTPLVDGIRVSIRYFERALETRKRRAMDDR